MLIISTLLSIAHFIYDKKEVNLIKTSTKLHAPFLPNNMIMNILTWKTTCLLLELKIKDLL